MLYDNIKYYAERKGLSILKVEREAGLSRGHIDKWKQSTPRLDTLQKVAEVLGVSITTLLKEAK